MTIKRQLSAEMLRYRLLQKFWVMAKNVIGEDFAFEIAEMVNPKVSSVTHHGLSNCSIDELKCIVAALEEKQVGRVGQVGQVGQLGQRKKNGQKQARRGAPPCAPKIKGQTRGPAPTGKPVVIGEWAKPATAWQTEKINDLAYELKISDEYLLGVLRKANGGIDLQGEMTVALAQHVIEALKAMKRTRTMFNNYQPIKKNE